MEEAPTKDRAAAALGTGRFKVAAEALIQAATNMPWVDPRDVDRFAQQLLEKYDEAARSMRIVGLALKEEMDRGGWPGDRPRCARPIAAAGILLFRRSTRQILVTCAFPKDGSKSAAVLDPARPTCRRLDARDGAGPDGVRFDLQITGGKRLGDESALEAAVREFREETAEAVGDQKFWEEFLEDGHTVVEISSSAYSLYLADAEEMGIEDLDAIPAAFPRAVEALRAKGRLKADIPFELRWVPFPDSAALLAGPWSAFARTVLRSKGVVRRLGAAFARAAPAVEPRPDVAAVLERLKKLPDVRHASFDGKTLFVDAAPTGRVPASALAVVDHAAWHYAKEHIQRVALTNFLLDCTVFLKRAIRAGAAIKLENCTVGENIQAEFNFLRGTNGELFEV